MLNTQKDEIVQAVKAKAQTTDDISLMEVASALGISSIARQDVQDIRNRVIREMPELSPVEKAKPDAFTLFQTLHFVKG